MLSRIRVNSTRNAGISSSIFNANIQLSELLIGDGLTTGPECELESWEGSSLWNDSTHLARSLRSKSCASR